MKQKTEAQLLKEIRQLKREKQELERRTDYLEKVNRIAEGKIDFLNKLIKTHDETVKELRESLEHARSLHPFNP